MSFPNRADFLKNHLKKCAAPPESRCTICLDDLYNGEQVICIEHGNSTGCIFHKDCLIKWLTTIDLAHVVQKTHASCPNDREPLFEPERVVNGESEDEDGPATFDEIALIASRAMLHLITTRLRAVQPNSVALQYRVVWQGFHEESIRGYADQLMNFPMLNSQYRVLGRGLRDAIQAWDMAYWHSQRVAMPVAIRNLRRHAGRLRELGVSSPAADVDRNADRAQALLDGIGTYLASDSNTVISAHSVMALREIAWQLEGDVGEASIRRASFGYRGLRDSN